MMRKFLFYLMLLFSGALLAQQTPGTIAGKVTDEKGEAVMAATATAKQSGRDVTSTSTDIDGFFDLSGLQPGSYDLEITYIGYKTTLIPGISISSGGRFDQNVKLNLPTEGIDLTIIDVVAPKMKQATDGKKISGETLSRMSTVDISSIAAMSTKTSQKDEGQAVSTAGARTSSNNFYVDGQRVTNTNIPAEEVESMEVLTGGLPAMYGDVTGSITSVTLKMPSSTFSGYVDYQNSLDAYQLRRGTVGVSGPILTNGKEGKDRKNIIGFRLSGNGTSTLDGSPSALGSFKLKDEAYNAILANPLTIRNGNQTPSAIFINRDMLEATNIRPNNSEANGQLNGSLFFQINKDMEVRVQGKYGASNNKDAREDYRLFNYDRNPTSSSNNWRVMGRFIHTIPITEVTPDKTKSSTSLRLSKMFYSLQADYEQINTSVSDPIHKDNLFGYGHVGAFYNNYVFRPERDSSYSMDFVKYDPTNSSNPIASRYNNGSTAREMGGFVYQNGIANNSVVNFYGGGLYAAPGSVYNLYQKTQINQLGLRVQGGLELKGKGLNKHTVSFGFTFEQRTDRSYRINPRELWTQARQKVNSHIEGRAVECGTDADGNKIYCPYANTDNIVPFASNLRKVLGVSDKTWVNVDELDPSKLSMSMFSADELTSQRTVFDRFYGYDYLGNPLGSDVKFDNFFTPTNIDGRDVYERRVAPFSPTYFAGYLEDNFHFQGATIRLGLRLDRYDANTKVLKDPYTLYSAYTVSDFKDGLASVYKQIDPKAIPSTVPSTAVVYLGGGSSNDLSNRTALLYRDGSQWYNGEGVQINNPSELVSKAGLSVPMPARTDAILTENIQTSNKYDYQKAFVDYKPSLILMPRLFFSFPFNDSKSQFFAHYDIVSERPDAGQGFASAFDYYNFQSNVQRDGFIFGNPNLKPQQVTDYAVGFLQALGEKENASIKMEFYYKEFRNMMQFRKLLFAYPATYDTYDNIDFSTTKGLSVEYNVTPNKQAGGRTSLMVNYTLQFADGTGSSASSSAGSAAVLEGQLLRTSFPLAFDTRHRFVVNADYRFRSGDGPKIGKTHILENVGINLTTDLQSGTPYSRKQFPTSLVEGDGINTIGSLNGIRQPWLVRFDFKIDKSFAIMRKIKGAESGDRKRLFGINVYLRVQNLLNTQNVINVYNATGTALNDGYLTDGSANGPQTLQSNIASFGTDSYGIMYDLRMRNPANISQPRRIFLGVNFSF
jgi:hypothetical protein